MYYLLLNVCIPKMCRLAIFRSFRSIEVFFFIWYHYTNVNILDVAILTIHKMHFQEMLVLFPLKSAQDLFQSLQNSIIYRHSASNADVVILLWVHTSSLKKIKCNFHFFMLILSFHFWHCTAFLTLHHMSNLWTGVLSCFITY